MHVDINKSNVETFFMHVETNKNSEGFSRGILWWTFDEMTCVMR